MAAQVALRRQQTQEENMRAQVSRGPTSTLNTIYTEIADPLPTGPLPKETSPEHGKKFISTAGYSNLYQNLIFNYGKSILLALVQHYKQQIDTSSELA